MPPSGGKATPIDPGVVSRIAGAVRGMIRGASDGWFGPQQPLLPVAPEEVRGRQFDYPTAVNLNYRPRSEQGETGIDFATLRALADPTGGGLDLLRLAIEKRKDQMEGQLWTVRGRDDEDGGDLAREIEQELRRPDVVHTYRVWQRMLLEDLLVIDAPVIYHAPGGKNGWRIPQVMDGALLKPLLRPDGRTPLPPEPAFQQALKGLPAVDYSLDEVTYAPRNLRSHRIYGMSPVEQVVMTVSIALRRQLSQLEYYTAGSVPDMVFGVPDTWTSDQIRQFQALWDAMLSGNTEERRRARFVPGGMAPVQLKPDQLKDMFDEWLARIVCFCFNLSPQALVKETNRATAETSKESAQQEGLEPIKLWWKDVMDEVLEKDFGAPDLEFAYNDEEITNPVDKANVISIQTGKKAWITQDEARAAYGMVPMTPQQQDELNPAPPPPPPPPALALGGAGQGGQQPQSAKVAKAATCMAPINYDEETSPEDEEICGKPATKKRSVNGVVFPLCDAHAAEVDGDGA